MGYHPRIERTDIASFLTTRTRNSLLWFINNRKLEHAILGYAAKFADRYGVKLYALAIEGNHIQGPALFPRGNRACFMRDLNSCIAKAVDRFTAEYEGGRLWARRYSSEFLPGDEDIEEYFFYTVLQQVKDGLVEKLSDYPAYNCFHDAIHGISREFKVVRWRDYNERKRFDPNAKISDFTDKVKLKYARLPGYENLSQAEYAKLMLKKLEDRRQLIIKHRLKQGLGFVGKQNLLKTKRGSPPKTTKTSDLNSHRPRVLSICDTRRAECKAWYFKVHFEYKKSSREYRNGNCLVGFPEGTYKPICAPNSPPELA